MASIGCPDGSSVDTDISFDAVKSVNGTILGNWTIDSTESKVYRQMVSIMDRFI